MTNNFDEYSVEENEEAYNARQEEKAQERKLRDVKRKAKAFKEAAKCAEDDGVKEVLKGKQVEYEKKVEDIKLGRKRVAKSPKSGTIAVTKDLSHYIGKEITKTDNQSVREWYKANVQDIPNQIDKSKPFEDQVKQAYELRNKYKHDARVAMSDRTRAEELEQDFPPIPFDDLLKDKMSRKKLSKEDALKDILETASKTNADVDKEFGL